ncbi:MAG: DUF1638 domain-containing protein [Acidimicrobiales bacterium]
MTTSIIACGALGPSIREISARRGWDVEIHLLPSLLHNRPAGIAPRVERLAGQLQSRGDRVVLAYADCGTYGALDELCARLEMRRLAGLHCYDVFAGASAMQEIFEREPGTYVLTDFLVRSFRSSVVAELGLDVHPELWPEYFAHYTKVVWLAQDLTSELADEARTVAAMFDLPLDVVTVGTGSLEDELEELIFGSTAALDPASFDAQVTG